MPYISFIKTGPGVIKTLSLNEAANDISAPVLSIWALLIISSKAVSVQREFVARMLSLEVPTCLRI